MPAEATLAATLPRRITKRESRADWTARLRKALGEREKALRAARIADERPITGRKKVLRLKHTDSPKTTAPRRSLRPAIACKDSARRTLALEALDDFRTRYQTARLAWIGGNRRVEFPSGTYRLRAFGVRCAPFPAQR